MNKVKSETSPTYQLFPAQAPAAVADNLIIEQAKIILQNRMARATDPLSSPQMVKDHLIMHIALLEHEVFGMLHLDNRHRLIEDEQLFRGTLDGASGYPREVAKSMLAHNSAAVILYHNHPSGVPEPSQADQTLTRRLQDTSRLIDVRVLDHIVVGGTETVSFAERGLI
jgi:DNA repair protein RadC